MVCCAIGAGVGAGAETTGRTGADGFSTSGLAS